MNERRLNLAVLLPGLALLCLGVVMVYSASAVFATTKLHNPSFFLSRQSIFALLGMLTLYLAWQLDFRVLQRFVWPLAGLAILLLVVVLIPGVGRSGGGAVRWISLGSLSLQPGELAKPILVVVLAALLAKRREREMAGEETGNVLKALIVPGIMAMLLMLEPDFGSTVIVAVITGVMLFVNGARLSYLILTVLGLLPVAYIAVVSTPYRMRRMMSFLDPWSHRHDIGYQVSESLISIGSGGLTGLGIGDGRQKLFFLPAAHTDFIFSIISEELGFVGSLFVVACFVSIVLAGLLIARRAHTVFGSYLALGLTTLIGLQAMTNMSVTLGLVPTKGLTLPMVSYGGSSLIATCLALGILLSIDACDSPEARGETS